MSYCIEGPYNRVIVLMEKTGQIHDIFYDEHRDSDVELDECVYIVDYIRELIKSLKDVDYFLETIIHSDKSGINWYRDLKNSKIAIHRLRYHYHEDKTRNKNPNKRYHNADIRHATGHFSYNILNELKVMLENRLTCTVLESVLRIIKQAYMYYIILYSREVSSVDIETINNDKKTFVNCIFANIYNDLDDEKKEIFYREYVKYTASLNEKVKNIRKFFINMDSIMEHCNTKDLEVIRETILNNMLHIMLINEADNETMNLYVFGRLLNKKVKYSIVYTGGIHAENIVNMLIDAGGKILYQYTDHINKDYNDKPGIIDIKNFPEKLKFQSLLKT